MKRVLTLFIIFLAMCNQFSFAKKEKDAQKEEFPAKMSETQGYTGTLPNLEERFKIYQTEEAKPIFEYKEGFNNPNEIKPVPRNNPAFINIIMKQDKSSQYLNDLNDIIDILDKLETIIENKGSVQVFNSKAFYLDKNVEYFRNKYKNKAESSFISFKDLMQLNTQVQAIAQLRLESELYSPYVTADSSGNTFSKNNINVQLDYLLTNLKKTMVTLKEVR